jgi:hypothetical protein
MILSQYSKINKLHLELELIYKQFLYLDGQKFYQPYFLIILEQNVSY